MECEGQVNTRPTISYKDVVSCPIGSRSPGSSATLDDDDIELLEDDIAIGVFNGIPTIDFSNQVQQLAIKSMDLTLVVKDICPTSHSNENSSLPPTVLPPRPASVVPISIPDEPFGPWMLVERRKRNSKVPNSAIRVAREDHPQCFISNPIFTPLVADSESHPDGVIHAIEDQNDSFMEVSAIPNQSNIVSNSSEISIQQPAKVNAKGKQSGISKKSTTLILNPKQSGIAGPTGLKLRHAFSLPAMHNSRTAASSSKVLASKPTVALDPVKHKAVHLPAATPPIIPFIAPSASVQDGQEAMLE
ncbi:hypothetical protein V6N11_018856 [Hibiscus sabdariffa]|uniref:Uncharacterized protein n=1 Tax=Hibiscus sabdariffa TaxID=183260 RepID=A0ABR2N8V7_9ROSI